MGWNQCSNGFNCHVLKMPKDKKLADKDKPMRSGRSGMQERIRDLLGPADKRMLGTGNWGRMKEGVARA